VQYTKTRGVGNTPNHNKIYQIVIAFAYQKIQNIPNDLEIYQKYPFQGLPKDTKIVIFHLATLIRNSFSPRHFIAHSDGELSMSDKKESVKAKSLINFELLA
jgi:hypothetical protein